MNVPKLRFKEFNGEWKQDTLLNLSTEISYGMNCAAKEYDGINKYIRITDIDEITNKYKNDNIVSPSGDLDNKFIVKENDILFARTGASTGKTYLYNINDGKMYYAGFLIKASIKNHNANFIFQQTKLNRYNKWLKIMSQRSGQPGINSQEYGDYKFYVCSKDEEDKIAYFLSLLDKKIELQSKKIEDLKLYKIGLKDILFNGNFEKVKLKTILSKWNEKNKDNKCSYVESVSNKFGFISQNEQFEDRSVASNNKSNYYVIRKDVFAYNPSRLNVGSLALKLDNNISLVSPLYECFTTNQNVIFLYEWFDSKEFKKGTISKYEGGVRSTLNFTNLCNITISLPSRGKQNEIADLLTLFNNKIDLENNKLNKLQELKKGLMQNMFV